MTSTSRSKHSETSNSGPGAYVSRVRELVKGLSVKSYIPANSPEAQAAAAPVQRLNASASAPALGGRKGRPASAPAPGPSSSSTPKSFERTLRGGGPSEREERQQWKIERLADRQLIISRPRSSDLNPHFHMGPHASEPASPPSSGARPGSSASRRPTSSPSHRGQQRVSSAKPPRPPPPVPMLTGPPLSPPSAPPVEEVEEGETHDATLAMTMHAADLRSEAELYGVAFEEALALVCGTCAQDTLPHLRAVWSRIATVAASCAAAVDAACGRMRRQARQHEFELGRSKGQAAELFKRVREGNREMVKLRNRVTELESDVGTLKLQLKSAGDLAGALPSPTLHVANLSLAPGQEPVALDYDERERVHLLARIEELQDENRRMRDVLRSSALSIVDLSALDEMLVMEYAELRKALKQAEDGKARLRRGEPYKEEKGAPSHRTGAPSHRTAATHRSRAPPSTASAPSQRSERSKKGEEEGEEAQEEDEAFHRLLDDAAGSKPKVQLRLPRTSSELASEGPHAGGPDSRRSINVDDTRDHSKEMEAAVREEQLAKQLAAMPDVRDAQDRQARREARRRARRIARGANTHRTNREDDEEEGERERQEDEDEESSGSDEGGLVRIVRDKITGVRTVDLLERRRQQLFETSYAALPRAAEGNALEELLREVEQNAEQRQELLGALEGLVLEAQAGGGGGGGGRAAAGPTSPAPAALAKAETFLAGRRESMPAPHTDRWRGPQEDDGREKVSAEVQTAALVARNRYVQTDDDPDLELPRLRRGPQLGTLTQAALAAAEGEQQPGTPGDGEGTPGAGGAGGLALPRATSSLSTLSAAKSPAKPKRPQHLGGAGGLQAPPSAERKPSTQAIQARRSRWGVDSPLDRSFNDGPPSLDLASASSAVGAENSARGAPQTPPGGSGTPVGAGRPSGAAGAGVIPPAWRPILAELRAAPAPMDKRTVLSTIAAIYAHREEAMEAESAASAGGFARGTISSSGLHTAPPPPPLPEVVIDALTAKFGYRHRFVRGLAEFAAGVRAHTAENHRIRLFARFCGMMTEWTETQGPLSSHALTVYLVLHGTLRAALARRGAAAHAVSPSLEVLVPADALEDALRFGLESRIREGSLAAVLGGVRVGSAPVPGVPAGYVLAETNFESAVEQWQRDHELADSVLMKLLKDFDDSRTGAISAAQFVALCRHLHPGLPPDAALRMYRHATEVAPGASVEAVITPDRFVLFARVGGLASSPSSPGAARAAGPTDFDQLEVAWRRSGAWVERGLEALDSASGGLLNDPFAHEAGRAAGPADAVRRMARSLATLIGARNDFETAAACFTRLMRTLRSALAEKGFADALEAAVANPTAPPPPAPEGPPL